MTTFYPYLTLTEYQNYSTIPADVQTQFTQRNPLFIQTVITGSTSTVNGYVQSRYSVPLSSVPFDLKMNVAKLVDYEVMSARGYRVGTKGTTDEQYRARRDDAIQWLQDVKNGLISLDGAALLVVSGSTTGSVSLVPDIDLSTGFIGYPSTYGSRFRNW